MDKEPVVHVDYFGRELNVDDFVVYCGSKTFQVGRVSRLGNKMVMVVGYDQSRKNWKTQEALPHRVYGDECLKVDEQEVTLYLLKKTHVSK